MAPAGSEASIARIVVATDGSPTAGRAVAWAAGEAHRSDAELVLLRVVAEPDAAAEAETAEQAREAAGPRGRAKVKVHDDPARGIVEGAEEEHADLLVVGNVGMGGRKEFLLANVPNRVSHLARCSVVIVNSVDGAGLRAERRRDESPEVEGRLLARAAYIGRVLAKHGLEERRAGGAGSMQERARRLRAALEELGPTFAKLGQILSTRPDLLPPEFADELARLQEDVAPLTEAEVVAVMERELSVPWEDVFASMDPNPLAAGTIGQVHRATLESGERVVLKVQRPAAEEAILRDVGLLDLFAEQAMSRVGLREIIDIPALVEHLSTSLRRELNFRLEAENIERMRAVLAPYARLAVPLVHGDLSTKRLLVMEEVEGVPLREAPKGEEARAAARELLEAYLGQVLTDGFFHADPHPGNLRWCEGKIYFLDLGMVGELDPELRELMLVLLLAFWREDPAFLTETMLMLSGDDASRVDLQGLEAEFATFLDRFRGDTLSQIQLGPMLEGLIEVASRHGVRLPAALALSGKAFGQMQLAVAELDPTLDPFSLVSGFLRRTLVGRIREQANPARVYYEAEKLRLRMSRIVEAIERATGARPGAKLQVEFRGAPELEAAILRTGMRLALGAATAAGIVATGLTVSSTRKDRRVAGAFGAVAAASAAWLGSDLVRRG
ncbi:MAG: universal stress protein [Thermoleophilia bacterium]|nr:universal stress protein [Thermoleophilia bacterium]